MDMLIIEKIMIIAMFFLLINKFKSTPRLWLFSVTIFLSLLICFFTFKLLTKVTLKNSQIESVPQAKLLAVPKTIYPTIVGTFLLLRLGYLIFGELLNYAFPYTYNDPALIPTTSPLLPWFSDGITITLVILAVAVSYKIYPAEGTKRSWLTLLISTVCLYIFTLSFPVFIGMYISHPGRENFLLIPLCLLLLLSIVSCKIPYFKNQKVADQAVVRLALIVFAVAFMINSFFGQYLFYSNATNIYYQAIIILLLIFFSKRLSKILTE